MQKIGFQTTKTNETPAKNWNMTFDVVVVKDKGAPQTLTPAS